MLEILVCSYNDAAYLPHMFESLCAQTVEMKPIRIIFVDNASTDHTREIVDQYVDKLTIDYIFEPRLGLKHAINTGYHHARADYVGHLEADVKAHPTWVETVLRVIEEDRPGAFGGRHFSFYVSKKPVWYLDKYNTKDLGREQRHLADTEYLNGVNMVWRREIVQQLGGFDIDVGLVGRGTARGDETNLQVRARRQIPDIKMLYIPDMIVYHVARPHTLSLWYWIRWNFSHGWHHGEIFVRDAESAPVSRSRLFKRGMRYLERIIKQTFRAYWRRDKSRYPYAQNYIYEEVLPLVQEFAILCERFLHYR